MKRKITTIFAAVSLFFACDTPAQVIYNSFNADATWDNPPTSPIFELAEPTRIVRITNYHWNGGSGAIAEQVNGTIGLRRVVDGVDGDLVGTWPASTIYSAFGPPAYWHATPKIILPPGRYKVIDSDHATWSYTTSNIFEMTGANWNPGIGFSEVVAGYLLTIPKSVNTGSVLETNTPVSAPFAQNASGVYAANTIATLTATPNAGYVFTEWTGDAEGRDNPLSSIMNADKSITAVFSPDSRDPDGDNLTNYQEIVIHRTNPEIGDSDGDGFLDGFEVSNGTDPNDDKSKPGIAFLLNQAMQTAGLVGADAQPSAIPFHDGIPNLLKYAFNMNLAGRDDRTMVPVGTAGLPHVSRVSGESPIFRVEYLRRIGAGLKYLPQTSFSLTATGWEPISGIPQVTPVDALFERVVHEVPATADLMFGRVRVELEP